MDDRQECIPSSSRPSEGLCPRLRFCPVLPGMQAALGAWILLMAGSAWDPVLETLGHNLLPHARDKRPGEKSWCTGRRKEKQTIPGIAQSAVGACLRASVLTTAGAGGNDKQDEGVRVQADAGVLSVWHRASLSVKLCHHGPSGGDAGSAFPSVCVPLHLHAGDFTPRFQAPVGRPL